MNFALSKRNDKTLEVMNLSQAALGVSLLVGLGISTTSCAQRRVTPVSQKDQTIALLKSIETGGSSSRY